MPLDRVETLKKYLGYAVSEHLQVVKNAELRISL